MQHISCEKYPVIGWLINQSFEANRHIHRTTLVKTNVGRINAYYHMQTFILECDTDGDLNPNEYYFFAVAEKETLRAVMEQMMDRLGMKHSDKTDELVEHTLQFISSDFPAE